MMAADRRFSQRAHRTMACLAAALAMVGMYACGNSAGTPSAPVSPTQSPQTYFAAAVSGVYPGNSISDSEFLSTYTIDDTRHTFAQSIYTFGSGNQKGPQLDYSGSSAMIARGLAEFDIAYSNGLYGASVNNGTGISYDPPLGGNWFFELRNQAGGIVNLKGMPFVPLVAAEQCPTGSGHTTYNFVSIPTYIGADLAGTNGGIQNWSPNEDTAYGIVTVSSAGAMVTFGNIQQYTASGARVATYQDLAGDPPAVNSISGACSSTFYGNTISVPGQVNITNPGIGEIISAPAIVGIGPSGLLIENNGQTSSLVSNAGLSGYQPFMGSGTGALGVPQPSSQIDVSALMSAQFVGVSYAGGTNRKDWTSLVTSFGFPSQPSGCPPGTFRTPLFGGDYPGGDPTQSPPGGGQPGYGNCDVVIDLGTQDSSNNGLFRNARVYLGNGFGARQSSHSFPAAAIVGQLDSKYAVFVIGVDTVGNPEQAWGIYLFQSN